RPLRHHGPLSKPNSRPLPRVRDRSAESGRPFSAGPHRRRDARRPRRLSPSAQDVFPGDLDSGLGRRGWICRSAARLADLRGSRRGCRDVATFLPRGASTMIIGAHSIIYSKKPEADRAFLLDVLDLPSVDVGGGWLIFGLPPAEVAVHPS